MALKFPVHAAGIEDAVRIERLFQTLVQSQQ
jgi:hypothetical protein